jgi:hypothetical protein
VTGKGALVVVFLVSFAGLGYRFQQAGIAASYVDPMGKIRAQDEAVYSHSAIRMARQGDWLTPRILGRYALYKPPLLLWLSGFSAKLLGVSPLSLRLPSLLAGALVGVLLFAWLRTSVSLPAAVGAVALLLSNPLWHSLSRLCLTDALLSLFIVAALLCLFRDPRLTGPFAFYGFGAFTGAAIMTKSIAGLLPFLVLLVYSLLARGEERPSARRIFQAGLLAGALAVPWHLYQLLVHPRWFWAEYVQVEILTFGFHSPYQSTQENHLLYYVKRLLLTDPVLCFAALLAAPWLLGASRRRQATGALLLVCWLGVIGASVFCFHYRNTSYLMPLIPALAALSVSYGPLFAGKRALAVTSVLCLLSFLKACFPDRPWGLSYQPAVPVASAPLLEAYARQSRPNELILVWPDDEFNSALMGLPRVRYCLTSLQDDPARYGLDFRYLGINVTARQFVELEKWRPIFAQRLRAWGLDSDEPVASFIVARSTDEVLAIILARPQSDFFLPEELRSGLEPRIGPAHRLVRVSP